LQQKKEKAYTICNAKSFGDPVSEERRYSLCNEDCEEFVYTVVKTAERVEFEEMEWIVYVLKKKMREDGDV
jgi:hypothetical protein